MELIKNNRRAFSFIAILVFLILLLQVFSGFLVRWLTSDWSKTLSERIELIEQGTTEIFKAYQSNLVEASEVLKNELSSLTKSKEIDFHKAFAVLDNEKFSGFEIFIFNNDTDLIAWSDKITQDINSDFKNKLYNSGECFVNNAELLTYLSIFDSLGNISYVINLPIEKEYYINKEYFQEISIKNILEKKFNTNFVIQYVASKDPTLDGRKYTFPVNNNFNNTIAYVTIDKPAKNSYIISLHNNIANVEAILIFTLLFFVGLILYKNKNSFTSRFVKFVILVGYLFSVRVTLFLFSIPGDYFNKQLNNPDYFYSEFAFGIVKSPIELFVTSMFSLLVVIVCLRYIIQYLNDSGEITKPRYLYIGGVLFYLSTFLLIFRGFGASMRSIIFESSLRYFKYPSLLPDIPTLVMDLNILVLGFCTIILLITFTVFTFKFIQRIKDFSILKIISVSFILFQFSAFVFDAVQKQPQGTPLLRFISISIIFIFALILIKEKKATLAVIISILFASSLITIGFLTYYNSDFEVKSLRSTAYELLKPEEELLEDLVKKTLEDELIHTRLQNVFNSKREVNYNSVAFQIWSKSDFENESISSLVNIVSKDKKLLGSYNFQLDENFIWDWSDKNDSLTKPKYFTSIIGNSENKIIRGIAPVYDKVKLLGYIEISVLIDHYALGFEDTPQFFSSAKKIQNSPVNLKQLKIFDFQNGEIVNYYTDLIPSKPETEEIVNVEFNKFNEAWLNISLNNIGHIVYVKKIPGDKRNRMLAVALAEKDLSWNLFDFFKIFLVHSLFIFVGLLIAYPLYFQRQNRIRYSFRVQLLFAFIFISTVPLVFLALYFKNLTEDKNTSAIYYKLGKRADGVELYLEEYSNQNVAIDNTLLNKASKDLGISFDLYIGTRLIYSSEKVYYDVGLIPKTLNADVYRNLILTGLKEYVFDENIERYTYHSFYHKANINGTDYLIKVTDLFNSIQLPMSALEVDIFLFGSYSFAIILVILFSTVLANRISSPIRRLTRATKQVAQGNLNLLIEEKNKGEVGELVDGFNEMVKELNRNQKELAEMEREAAWRDMAKQVAHEIKNPLTPMKLAVQQLVAARNDNSDKFDDIFTKVTQTIIRQIDILKNIATEFSNFAKMPELKIENVNLKDTLKYVANLFMQEKIQVNCSFENNGYIIKADLENLQRTFTNLVKNSQQAGATNVSFEVTRESGKIQLRIIDNGSGIPEHIKHRIFDASFTTKIEGMGLGLNMAKKFLESINAHIELEKSTSQGTVILIIFQEEVS